MNATKNPAAYRAAENQSANLLSREASSQAFGFSGEQPCILNRGPTQYVFTKLAAIRTPEIAKVQFLCRDSATSHGSADNVDATVAPSPASTSSDGNAQHSSVPTDPNSET